MKRFSVILPLFLIIALASYAQQTPPSGGEQKDFKLPALKTFTLDNGLKVTLVPFGKIPKASVNLVVRSGNLNEAENEVWLSDFTGLLMKEGTTSRSGQKIADEAASMGGTLIVTTGMETTSVSGDVLSEFTPSMAALIADVAMNPIFPDSEVPRIKNDMLRDLSIQKSQPSNIAFELFARILYPGHPYGRIFPSQATIESFNSGKAKAFYNENFGGLRSHLFVAGVFDESAVEKAVREAFRGWQKGKEPLINVPRASSEGMIHFVNRPGAPQSVLNIGMPVSDPSSDDYIPLVLTNSLLGGSFTSRITLNIREDKGYTYSPYSRITSRYKSAFWMQFAEVETSVTGPSLKEIMYEIHRLTEEPVSSGELKGIKNYLGGRFVMANSTNAGIISQLAFLDLHGLDISWLNNYISNIQKVTAEDVQGIMRKYFSPDKFTIVIAGDRQKVEKGVKAYGKITDEK
jgi:predicted Zn-dependent peptidase